MDSPQISVIKGPSRRVAVNFAQRRISRSRKSFFFFLPRIQYSMSGTCCLFDTHDPAVHRIPLRTPQLETLSAVVTQPYISTLYSTFADATTSRSRHPAASQVFRQNGSIRNGPDVFSDELHVLLSWIASAEDQQP